VCYAYTGSDTAGCAPLYRLLFTAAHRTCQGTASRNGVARTWNTTAPYASRSSLRCDREPSLTAFAVALGYPEREANEQTELIHRRAAEIDPPPTDDLGCVHAFSGTKKTPSTTVRVYLKKVRTIRPASIDFSFIFQLRLVGLVGVGHPRFFLTDAIPSRLREVRRAAKN
jgi:hypothetical protein